MGLASPYTPILGAFFNCSGNEYLELISDEIINMTSHTQVQITFDLVILNEWQNGNFSMCIHEDNGTVLASNNQTFSFTNDSSCSGANPRIFSQSFTINHTSADLTLKFAAQLSSYQYTQSMVIQNLEVYLIDNCDPSCLSCTSTTPSICTNCPFNSTIDSSTSHCVCPDGWYMNTSDYAHCEECDISCEICTGPSNCTICVSELGSDVGSNGTCIPYSSYIFFNICLNLFVLDVVSNPLEFPNSQVMSNASLLQNWTISENTTFVFGVSRCGSSFLVGGDNNFGTNSSLSRTFNNLLPHYFIVLSFDLYLIGLWTKAFFLYVDSNAVINLTHQFITNPYTILCGINSQTDVFRFDLNHSHTASNLSLIFNSSLTLNSTEASWGINNFILSFYLCDLSCATCSGNGSDSCESCYGNATISNGVCTCNLGYYQYIFTEPCTQYPCSECLPCLFECQTCSDANECLICNNGYYLSNDGENCTSCSLGCDNCTDENTCFNCFSGYFLNLINQECVTICPNTTIIVNNTTCDICSNGTFIFNNTCYSECPGNLFKNDSTCVTQCPIYTDSDEKTCISTCPDDKFLFYDNCSFECPPSLIGSNRTCVEQCPDSQIVVNQTCVCHTGDYTLNNTLCVSACPQYYYSSINNTCLSCYSNCLTCNGPNPNECLSCPSGEYLNYDFTCISACPSYYFENSNLNTCVKCQINCKICQNEDNCSLCSPNYILINNVCKRNIEMYAEIITVINPYSFKIRSTSNWEFFITNYQNIIQNISIDLLVNNRDYTFVLNPNQTLYYDIDLFLTYDQTFQNNDKNLNIWLNGDDSSSDPSNNFYINQNLSCALEGIAIICSDDQYFSTSSPLTLIFYITF